MTEELVLESFERLSNRIDDSQNKLNRTVTNSAHQVVANLIFNSNNHENSGTIYKRKNLIEFLRLLCNEDANHLNLNCSNYRIAVEEICQNSTDDEIQKLTTKASDDYMRNPESLMHNIVQHYDRINERQCKKKEFALMVKNKDKEQMNLPFELYKDTKKVELIDVRDTLSKLLGKQQQDIIDVNHIKISKVKRREKRSAQVACAYALLSLYKTNVEKAAFEQVLKRISYHEDLIKQEHELLNYVLASSNLEATAAAFKYFQHLYEVPIVKLCTQLLQAQDRCEVTKLISDSEVLKVILSVGRRDLEFRSKLLDLLLELFTMSSYHNHLLEILRELFR